MISVRRTVTEPKMILAGGMHSAFSARFVVSEMAAISGSMAPSWPSGWWDAAFMVETRGGRRKTLEREGYEEDS